MATATKDVVQRSMRDKMDYNSAIIMSASKQITLAVERLQDATKVQSMDAMNIALKEIVDASVSCRSRLQFMRGVWSYYKDLMDKMEVEDEGRH